VYINSPWNGILCMEDGKRDALLKIALNNKMKAIVRVKQQKWDERRRWRRLIWIPLWILCNIVRVDKHTHEKFFSFSSQTTKRMHSAFILFLWFFLFPFFNFKHFALFNLLLEWNFDDIKGEKIHSSLTKSDQCFVAERNAYWSYCLMIVCVMCKITCFVVILHYLELLLHIQAPLHYILVHSH